MFLRHEGKGDKGNDFNSMLLACENLKEFARFIFGANKTKGLTFFEDEESVFYWDYGCAAVEIEFFMKLLNGNKC